MDIQRWEDKSDGQMDEWIYRQMGGGRTRDRGIDRWIQTWIEGQSDEGTDR